MNRMNDGMNCMHVLALIAFFVILENFYQATHDVIPKFIPGGTFSTTRRRMTLYQNYEFLDELPGSDEHHPDDAS